MLFLVTVSMFLKVCRTIPLILYRYITPPYTNKEKALTAELIQISMLNGFAHDSEKYCASYIQKGHCFEYKEKVSRQ